MEEKKYFRKTFTVSFLIEEEQLTNADLKECLEQSDNGSMVQEFQLGTEKIEELTAKEVANALNAAGSEPGFFNLDDDGNCVHNYFCNCVLPGEKEENIPDIVLGKDQKDPKGWREGDFDLEKDYRYSVMVKTKDNYYSHFDSDLFEEASRAYSNLVLAAEDNPNILFIHLNNNEENIIEKSIKWIRE